MGQATVIVEEDMQRKRLLMQYSKFKLMASRWWFSDIWSPLPSSERTHVRICKDNQIFTLKIQCFCQTTHHSMLDWTLPFPWRFMFGATRMPSAPWTQSLTPVCVIESWLSTLYPPWLSHLTHSIDKGNLHLQWPYFAQKNTLFGIMIAIWLDVEAGLNILLTDCLILSVCFLGCGRIRKWGCMAAEVNDMREGRGLISMLLDVPEFRMTGFSLWGRGKGDFQWHLQHIRIWARHLASTFLLLYCSCPFRELGNNKAHVYTVHLSSIQLYPRNCPDTVSCSEFLKGNLHIYSLHAMSGYLTHGSLDAAQKALQPMTRELQNVHLWVCPFLTDTRKSTDDNALAKATVQALIAFLAWSVLSEHVLPACCNQPWPLHLFVPSDSACNFGASVKICLGSAGSLLSSPQDRPSFRHNYCRVGSWKQ